MEFDYDYLRNPLMYKEGCTAPHSDHLFYRNEQELRAGCSSFRFSLNGLWKFHYARNYGESIKRFEKPGYDCKSWEEIHVPAHIQMEGYDAPQYVNIQYPWEGHEELIPGEVPEEFNPVGSYVKYFSLPDFMKGKRVFLVLEGAESAAAVWLNGKYIGYHEDSFTPGEFELTKFLKNGENKLAVQVFKWCLGSWCEDQDFFRFSGLYRDVYLYAIPETHIWDLDLRAVPRDDLKNADFSARTKVYGKGAVTLELLDGEKSLYRETKKAAEEVSFCCSVEDPHLWSAEDPYLYQCRISVSAESGESCELISQKVGFRRFEMKNGLMCLNGKRIVFNGVNRHEFNSLRGRSLRKEDVEQDLRIIKQNNINAVRTCHYPNASWLYGLCDAYGIYLIDETNMESHGTWDLTGQEDDRAYVVPNDRLEWLDMMLERALSMYERDKNHPSVLIWSCGNESYGGSVVYDMARLFKGRDDTRLVHYEGVFNDRRYSDTSDMESQMYTPAKEIEEFLYRHPEKPFICCEYCHAMGNSCGALFKYTELARRNPLYQGGFIWDFADQALVRKNRFGEDYLAYGGDFDDRPTDYNFCGNGLVSGDRKISPKMQEVKFQYQSIGIAVSPSQAEISNRNLFVNTNTWQCRVTVSRDGVPVEEKILETCVAPGETVAYPLNLREQTMPGYYSITVSFHLKQDTYWAHKDYEIAFGQDTYRIADSYKPPVLPYQVIHSKHNIGVRGENFEVLFSLMHGGLASYKWGGRELLDGIPKPNFWRAPTDNDYGNQMPARYGQWKLASLYGSTRRVTGKESELMRYDLEEKPDCAVICFRYWLPTNPESFCSVSYQVFGSGKITVTMHYEPVEGLEPMPEFSLLMSLKAELDHLTWYGLGPAETYWDRQTGGRVGRYQNLVGENMAPYLLPQECGNKEKVHWAELTDKSGRGIRFEAETEAGCCFSALPFTPHQMELADHAYELPRPVHTIVRVGMEQMGVGGDNSWGARTHDEFLIRSDQEHTFAFSFRGI